MSSDMQQLSGLSAGRSNTIPDTPHHAMKHHLLKRMPCRNADGIVDAVGRLRRKMRSIGGLAETWRTHEKRRSRFEAVIAVVLCRLGGFILCRSPSKPPSRYRFLASKLGHALGVRSKPPKRRRLANGQPTHPHCRGLLENKPDLLNMPPGKTRR